MKHRFTIQGNLTWDKIMLHNGFLDNYAAVINKLEQRPGWQPEPVRQSSREPMNCRSSARCPAYERHVVGGWQVTA